ncbi:sensor domain-containing protein [Streptomyces sp. NPDC047002]|uniref:sensor histidine kinase n=1 Tax=Streptomyces sp. NPDC047002 TaxID=3155475 RepID=UPI003455F874
MAVWQRTRDVADPAAALAPSAPGATAAGASDGPHAPHDSRAPVAPHASIAPHAPETSVGTGLGEAAGRTLRASGNATGRLAGGFTTAASALALLAVLAVTAATAVAGVGLLMAPLALRALHALARRERERLGRTGAEVIAPEPPPTRPRAALADPTTRRELRWLCRHATVGLLLGLVGVWLPILAVRDTAFPLYWRFMPQNASATSLGFGTAHSWPDALAVALLGVGWIILVLGLTPGMARLQERPGRRLLAAGPDVDLSLRVAELTATRAAALDAHAVELRRIERALHDGTQNRLVSVSVLLGAARRQVARDPSRADEILERAQAAAEQALAELRGVSRSILPPVLDDRGLAGALSGLAAHCAVPCALDVDAPRRCAAAVEATVYFAAAEALTNIAKHSGAAHAAVAVRVRDGRLHLAVTDDGRGGAEEAGGSGLAGIRRRVAALDGTLRLASPPGGPTTLEVDLPCGT